MNTRFTICLVSFTFFALAISLYASQEYLGNEQVIVLKTKKSLHEIISLSEFKGKVVYGDMWGANCKPCIEELTFHAPILREKYRNNRNVVFLYISINFNKKVHDTWERLITSKKMTGYHISVNNLESYRKIFNEVTGSEDAQIVIPRYFIVDRAGNIVVRNAKKPSDTMSLYNEIDSVLARPNFK